MKPRILPIALLLLLSCPCWPAAAETVARRTATTTTATTTATTTTATTTATTETATAPPATWPSPAGIRHITSVEGIHEYAIPSNGMRVLLFPDPSRQTTTVNVTYLVGSRHENYGEKGMAHLLEHLLFKGTPNHPDIPQELTAHGCRPNGSTWFDRTNYFETFAATEENLAWALDLEADRMVNSFIAAKDLESEMTVVRNEFESGENDPRSVLVDRVLSTAFLWHNYGNTTIGSRSDIENVPIERLQAFYRTWYQPDNAVLVIAGKFDPEHALALTAETFGRIPRPERPLPITYTTEPAQDGERRVTLRRVGDIQVVQTAYHIPAGSHPEFAAAEVLAYILGDTPSGRLYKGLVETQKAASVSAWAMQMRDPALLLLTAEVRLEGSIREAEGELIRIAEELSAAPPTPQEVERARASLLRDWEMSMRDSQWAAIGLSEWAALGDWRLTFIHRDRLHEVTPADVQKVAATYLKETNRTVGLYIPTSEPERVAVPPPPDVAALVADYRGGAGMATGEAFEPAPEEIEERILRAELPSGMKLVLLPRQTRGRTVALSMSLHLGGEASLQGRAVAGDLAGSMLMRGTHRHDRQQIQDEFDRLQARFWVGGGAMGAWAGGECTTGDIEPFLRLAAEILREPSFPASEFELLRQERLLSLENDRSDPRSRADIALRRHMSPRAPEDPRYAATVDEEISRIRAATLAEVERFHREFYGASSAELALVGDFDPARVRELLTELFGDWRSRTPHERLRSELPDVTPADARVETPDKESAVLRAGLRIPMRDDHPDYPALVLANFMTGGGFLNSRLATRIRQKEGLSYGIGSWFWADSYNEEAWFGANAIYAPQNSDALMRAFREEIERMVRDGFTAEEVAEAKSGWLQGRKVSRARERELAGTLTSREYDGRTLIWDAEMERRVEALTAEEIHAAVRRHFDPAKVSFVQAGDFAKAGKAKAEGTTE